MLRYSKRGPIQWIVFMYGLLGSIEMVKGSLIEDQLGDIIRLAIQIEFLTRNRRLESTCHKSQPSNTYFEDTNNVH